MKIAVLISGGVDSSVALRLLHEQGHELTAFYLKIWLEDDLKFLGDCPWEEDLKYVREICDEIKVPLKVLPFQKEYFETVVAYTIDEVKKGNTPNPDMMCNNNIKFGLFLDKEGKNFDKVATGHYAQLVEKNGKFLLKRAPDPIKDQTYFLGRLSQKQLSKAMFPIGHLQKNEVRELAEKYSLPNKTRKDSQGICFLGKFKYNEFINHYLGIKKGDIVEYETGKKLGEHEGFYYYTVGQRKGIKLPDGPWYIVDKNIDKNIIYASKNYHGEDKKRNTLIVQDFNWFIEKPDKLKLKVKLRHGEQMYDCKINFKGETAEITLDRDDQGIAPGQFAVFYDDDICLGSASIKA